MQMQNDLANITNPMTEKTIDEVCCDYLDALYPRAGGTIWKAPVILKFKVRSSNV
jgi:hypothetical protein